MLATRFDAARSYLFALHNAAGLGWSARYEQFLEAKSSLPEGLALAHPSWLPSGASRSNIYGPELFETSTAVHRVGCESARLWLYECPFVASGLQGDHVFPRSLGGPTLAANLLSLCPLHNRLKGPDVHLYPWEEGEPSWLRDLLGRMHHSFDD